MPKLLPSPNSVAIRMYRIGHGDCFLLAFATDDAKKPTYVLIDCGYKPDSEEVIHTNADEVVEDLREATGGRIHVAVLTHEHQDHVNGITPARFANIEVDELWLAWTEDPDDDLANELRQKWHDQLLQLLSARQRLAAGGQDERVRALDQFLALELGAEGLTLELGVDALGVTKKQSMKIFKDKAGPNIRFLRPHEGVLTVPRTQDVKVFPFGPPRSEKLLRSMDPKDGEAFPRDHFGFFLGQLGEPGDGPARVFSGTTSIHWDTALAEDGFVKSHYAKAEDEWRRIDREWTQTAEMLALDHSKYTNNTSLVLAFEMGAGGKVLLFAADAQRGNWISWAGPGKSWQDGQRTVTPKDLMARTVVYKVGHHGSHNATLFGELDDEHPNLSWMATEAGARREFVSMITAVREWAMKQDPPWDHPLQSIREALHEKGEGRVFQTDTDLDLDSRTGPDWADFRRRSVVDRLYFQLEVER